MKACHRQTSIKISPLLGLAPWESPKTRRWVLTQGHSQLPQSASLSLSPYSRTAQTVSLPLSLPMAGQPKRSLSLSL